MRVIDLLNLDIRLLDPLFGAKGREDTDRERTDFGIFYLDDSDLKIVKIQGGWEIFKKAVYDYSPHSKYRAPILSRSYQDIVQKILAKNPSETRFPKSRFEAISERFVEAYAFTRLESDITLAKDYIVAKENMPASVEEMGEYSPEIFRMQEDLVNRMATYINDAPQLLGLPNNPNRICREVRLDNRLSRCIMNPADYEKFCSGNNPRHSMTICDFVVQYLKEFYIVEVKVTFPENRGQRITSIARYVARSQLVRAAIFFQKNFNVYPTLVRAALTVYVDDEELKLSHYKYYDYDKKLHRLEICFQPNPKL